MFRAAKTQAECEQLLAKATNPANLEFDWESALGICDLVRQQDIKPDYVVNNLKQKLSDENGNVQLWTLDLLDVLVKNCGQPIHEQVCQSEVLQELRHAYLRSTSAEVKTRALEVLACWAHGFRNSLTYSSVGTMVEEMKEAGVQFPQLREADTLFDAQVAPVWLDGSNCHRCRVEFSLTRRKHHCRACGNIFCHKCSSKLSTIPKFGLEKAVRVCDACFIELKSKSKSDASKDAEQHASTDQNKENVPQELAPELQEYFKSNLAQEEQTPQKKDDEQRKKEEEEIQLALAMSLSEAEAQQQKKSNSAASSKPQKNKNHDDQFASSELESKYLNRAFWEERRNFDTRPSAPIASSSISGMSADEIASISTVTNEPDQSTKLTSDMLVSTGNSSSSAVPSNYGEIENFASALEQNIDVFINRMNSNKMRGRPIHLDTTVQSLFQLITNMHPQLAAYLDQQDRWSKYYESLQEKVTQLKEAREVLEALKSDHREKLRRQAEEVQREKQRQMAQKLDVLRAKKQDLLHWQRQQALQKMHDDELQLQMSMQSRRFNYVQPAVPVVSHPTPTSNNNPGYYYDYTTQQWIPTAPMPNHEPVPQYAKPNGVTPASIATNNDFNILAKNPAQHAVANNLTNNIPNWNYQYHYGVASVANGNSHDTVNNNLLPTSQQQQPPQPAQLYQNTPTPYAAPQVNGNHVHQPQFVPQPENKVQQTQEPEELLIKFDQLEPL